MQPRTSYVRTYFQKLIVLYKYGRPTLALKLFKFCIISVQGMSYAHRTHP